MTAQSQPRIYGAEEFAAAFLHNGVFSHEIIHRLNHYAAMLIDWQTRMNLVAPSTIPHIWQRHFADSAQLYSFIPRSANILVDIGSGAGFPGLVLGLLAQAAQRPLQIHLVESVQKKAQFLRAVATELALDVAIHATRTESLKGLRADVITARALASLNDLCHLVQPFWQNHTVLLLPKGAKADEELTMAQKHWHFDCRKFPSQTDASGRILQIQQLHYKTTTKHRRPA